MGTEDTTTDTPTNNFCTLNPLSLGSDIRANGSFTQGNCELTNGGTTENLTDKNVKVLWVLQMVNGIGK